VWSVVREGRESGVGGVWSAYGRRLQQSSVF
jgi:hypothetical protein